jgi:putative spermidine/putrescine transport system substrate-binding protein
MERAGRNRGIGRRAVLRGAGALGLAAAAMPRPAIAQRAILTVSTWGGVAQDGIKAHVQPEFEKLSGATLAYDIGGQGARYNKLLAQRASPGSDVFLGADEALVAGHRAGVLAPASRKGLTNLPNLHDWALTLSALSTDATVPGVPFTLISYLLAYNPEIVKDRPTGWADMWRPEFRDKFAFAAPVHSQMPAFVIIAAELAGGSAANVDPGFKKLAELRPSKLTVFWTDWAPLNKTGDVILATDFDYYLETMKDQKYPIEYVVPKEKGIGTVNYVSVVKGTKHPALAELFLDLMISPKAQAAAASESFQGPTNKLVELSPAAQARCSFGARVDQLRFFDPIMFADKRATWTEQLNTEVVPNWRAR